jgi:hypothetical protein
LRERRLFYSLPFKGRVRVGMGYFRGKNGAVIKQRKESQK